MPTFDLKGIRVAKYSKTDGVVKYSDHTSVGEAMNCNLELKFAEGRLYSEGRLSEYLKLATGGSVSIGTKYIPSPAQILMYGATGTSRTVSTKPVKGHKFTEKSTGQYVGCAFYAPDMIDEELKFTCAFVPKTLFGPPSLVFQTKGESITFQTPTTTGEFLPANNAEGDLLEVAVCDTEDEAIAWTKLVLGETETEAAVKTAESENQEA